MEQQAIEGVQWILRAIELIAIVVIPSEMIFRIIRNRRFVYSDFYINVFCALALLLFHQVVHYSLPHLTLFSLKDIALFHIELNFFGILAYILVGDLCFYIFHRMAHTKYIFMVEHSVHHSSHEFDFSVNLRISCIAGLYGWTSMIIPVFIGFHPALLFPCYLLGNAFPFFCHTQRIGKLGWLEYIFNTPSHHRVHHGQNPQYVDKNFAGMFIIWDRLFGTFAEEVETVRFGIKGIEPTKNPFKVMFGGWYRAWKIMVRGRQNQCASVNRA